jgi:hypothetical protein
MSKKDKKPTPDPIEAQLRFEAQFYGDWYSESILSTYVADKSLPAETPLEKDKGDLDEKVE